MRAKKDADERNFKSSTMLECEERDAELFEKQSQLAQRKLEQSKKQQLQGWVIRFYPARETPNGNCSGNGSSNVSGFGD